MFYFLIQYFMQAGEYTARLRYHNGRETVAHWLVRTPATKRKAKNVLFFIGDGMSPPSLWVYQRSNGL